MENASKALLITGGVLIAIMILSIGVYLRGYIGKTSESYMEKMDNIELQKYNSYFERFLYRTDISAQEIVSIINIAKQKSLGTKVYIGGENYTNKSDYDENEFLTDNILKYEEDGAGTETAMPQYSIDITKGDDNTGISYNTEGRVTEIHFKKN